MDNSQIWLQIALVFALLAYAIVHGRKADAALTAVARNLRAELEQISQPNIIAAITAAEARNPVNKPLGDAWRAYSARLSPAPGMLAVDTTGAAQLVFGQEIRDHPQIKLKAYEAIPNRLVGLGLAATFFGLFIVLLLAQDTLGNTYEQTRKSLAALLQASSYKFLTSIIGILAAIALGWRLQYLTGEIEKAGGALAARLETMTRAPLFKESNDDRLLIETRKQTAAILRSHEALAEAISRKLEEGLSTHLPVAFDPLVAELRTITGDIIGINQAVLQQMIDRFTEQLGGATRRHLVDLAELIGAVTTNAQNLPAQLTEAAKAVTQAVVGAASEVRSLDYAVVRLNVASKDLSKAAGDASSMVFGLGDATKAALDRLTAATQAADGALTMIGGVSTALSSASQSTIQVAEQLAQSGARSISFAAEIQAAMRGAADNIGDLTPILSDAVHRAGGLLAAAEAANRSTIDAGGIVRDEAREWIRSFTLGVDQLDGALSKMITAMTDSVESLATRGATPTDVMPPARDEASPADAFRAWRRPGIAPGSTPPRA